MSEIQRAVIRPNICFYKKQKYQKVWKLIMFDNIIN